MYRKYSLIDGLYAEYRKNVFHLPVTKKTHHDDCVLNCNKDSLVLITTDRRLYISLFKQPAKK